LWEYPVLKVRSPDDWKHVRADRLALKVAVIVRAVGI
jgi:hypothetical protein